MTPSEPSGRAGVVPTFPGATSVTRLSVYPDAGADGVRGGTPHVHLASSEAYVVVGGHGVLQTVDVRGFRETSLAAGSTVWFTPGTIHRAVNHGDLEVVVVMQNAGLPEAGDAVMTFPPSIVGDPERYRQAAALPPGVPDPELAAAVRRRRDLAVDGFREITDAVRRGDLGPLERFYADAVALVGEQVERWRAIWHRTVEREAQSTAEVLGALARGDGRHLHQATVLQAPPGARWGMCGRLTVHDVAHPVVPFRDHERDEDRARRRVGDAPLPVRGGQAPTNPSMMAVGCFDEESQAPML